MSGPTADFYQSVIDDVIKNVSIEFRNDNLDDRVVQQLKTLWETKLAESGAVSDISADLAPALDGYQDPNSIADVRKFLQQDAWEAPAPPPSVPLTGTASGIGQQQQQQQQQHYQHQPVNMPSSIPPTAQALTSMAPPPAMGRPQQYLPRQTWAPASSTEPHLTLSATPPTTNNAAGLQNGTPSLYNNNGTAAGPGTTTIPQVDGGDDDDAATGAVTTTTTTTTTTTLTNTNAGDEDGDLLDSDLDDDSSEEEEDISDFLVCQYEKITRSRTRQRAKRKCQMKDGIFQVKGKDYVFKRATGECDF
eukprot:TRINITY_DN154_c0_g1_i2.p1 TRINITY_DN154_c0_g1~~TRINITY_DN154_c0_g1_i2.p1  ORF type:complete len:305 (+),score=90.54 TRINITY_DN154_c0_g1_i2:206-1120(+)